MQATAPSSNAPITATKPELSFIGQTIAFQAGRVMVALTWVRDSVYRVSVNHPGLAGLLGPEIDGASYSTEAEARTEARRMYRIYFAGDTPEQVEQRHQELSDLAETWVKRYGPEAGRRAQRYAACRDAIQPLAGRCADRVLANNIAETIAAAFAGAPTRQLVPAA